jgi:hypothetical protein
MRARVAVVLDDAADGHGTEPFAHAPPLKPSFGGKFSVSCLRHASHGIEETRPMTDRNHQTQGTAIEDIDYLLRESVYTGSVKHAVANFYRD